MAVLEVGNLLMLPARSGGNDEWNQRALDLIAQTKRVIPTANTTSRACSIPAPTYAMPV
jgi:hypothetical protein